MQCCSWLGLCHDFLVCWGYCIKTQQTHGTLHCQTLLKERRNQHKKSFTCIVLQLRDWKLQWGWLLHLFQRLNHSWRIALAQWINLQEERTLYSTNIFLSQFLEVSPGITFGPDKRYPQTTFAGFLVQWVPKCWGIICLEFGGCLVLFTGIMQREQKLLIS